jgi:hypothetical protein
MKLHCKHTTNDYLFNPVELIFEGNNYSDVFGKKKNKTVHETLQHPRYAKLKEETEQRYPKSLQEPLGTFLLDLKVKNDFSTRSF